MKELRTGAFAALSFALIILASASTLTGARTLKSYSKIFVVTATEDTTSEFHEILFYNNKSELVRVIDMWNGGHVGPAFAHVYAMQGKRSTYIQSIEPIWQSKTMVRDVLCKKLKTTKMKNPPRLNYNDLLMHGEDRVPFVGCD